jgi:hypothetical protein
MFGAVICHILFMQKLCINYSSCIVKTAVALSIKDDLSQVVQQKKPAWLIFSQSPLIGNNKT